VYSQLSGLEDVGFNDFIKDDFIPEGDRGEYKCDDGMSVENAPVVVNIKTLKGPFIAHKFSTRWAVGVMKSVEKKKSAAGHFAVT